MSILDQILNGFKEIFAGKKTRRKSIKKKKGTRRKVSAPGVKKKSVKTKKAVSRGGRSSPVRKETVKRKRKTVAGRKNQPAKPKALKSKKPRTAKPAGKRDHDKLIGEITHYFSKIQVAVVKIVKSEIKMGDKILIKGKSSAFAQQVKSLQIESVEVKSARKGKIVGMKVSKPAHVGDQVYLID